MKQTNTKMNKAVETIAKEGIVEEIVRNITKDSNDEDYKDLISDIYLALLEKDEATIEEMIQNKQIHFYISRMVVNNIYSCTSPFFYNYRKNKLKEFPIDEIATNGKNQADRIEEHL